MNYETGINEFGNKWIRLTDEEHKRKFWFLNEHETLARYGISSKYVQPLVDLFSSCWIDFIYEVFFVIDDDGDNVAKMIIGPIAKRSKTGKEALAMMKNIDWTTLRLKIKETGLSPVIV